ncbi:MAG: hypothetical protein JWQ99_3602, partial [Blastococcus sp.]|nr:hypothetical protein [Blastococcus sp.]
MSGAGSRPAPWPRSAVVGVLAVVAVMVGAQELLWPEWTAHAAPAVLGAATLAVGLLVLRHSRRLDALSTVTWQGFAGIAALLALGQVLRAAGGDGMNPTASGPSDLALAATGPVAVLICVRLVRSTRGRIRAQVVLDAAVAITALGALLEVVVPLATPTSGPAADELLTLGYPAVAAVLCAVGLVTLAGVSAPRRPAAGWLLACFASLGVAMVSGALAVAVPSPGLDVVTSTAYLLMVASATLALAADP